MRRTLPRWSAVMAALALAGLLSACDRKAPTPPTPSTAGSAPAQR
jgi:hypothetical protein